MDAFSRYSGGCEASYLYSSLARRLTEPPEIHFGVAVAVSPIRAHLLLTGPRREKGVGLSPVPKKTGQSQRIGNSASWGSQ